MRVHCCCCLPTPMPLAIGWSQIFPLVVHQPDSPYLASSAVTPAGFVRKSRGDNVGAVAKMMCGVYVSVT